MDSRNETWATVGRTLLMATVSHGWLTLAAALSLIAITHVSAIVLTRVLCKKESCEITIKTPFLTIKSRTASSRRSKSSK